VRGVLPAPQRGGASTERFRRDRRGWTAGLTDATALSRSLLGEQSPIRCDRPPNRTFAPGAAFTLNAVFHVETPRVLSADGRFRDRLEPLMATSPLPPARDSIVRLRGILPIAPTPFTEAGEVDVEGQRRVLDCMIDQGVDGICVLANFSEQFMLADAERDRLTELCLTHVAGRVPVIVTCSHFSTRIASDRGKRAASLGAAMLMLMPPYHGVSLRADEEGMLAHFGAVAEAARLPLLVAKPAPILVAWFNIFATTGMSCFDAIIGDEWVVKSHEERWYVERVIRLPMSCLTFDVTYSVPAVRPPPCLRNGFITFGSLASMYKLNAETIGAWARILNRSPRSRRWCNRSFRS